jgi:chlorophyllase
MVTFIKGATTMNSTFFHSQSLHLLILSAFLSLFCFSGCKDDLLYKSCGDFYKPGKLSITVISLEANDEFNTPVPIDIYTPNDSFRYPVIMFQHGFTGSIKGYETILSHLASHGFVVVAPQMYPAGGGMGGPAPTPEEEATRGVQIISWAEENLNNIVLVHADVSLLGLSGHSRGGQIAYRMTLQVPEKVKALSGVDPVDGLKIFGQELAINGPLDFNIPTYILGTGLGPVPPANTQFDLSCAPEDIGYKHFYAANPSPSWLAVATEHGHADMIDEEDLCVNGVCDTFCPGGPDRDGMRAFTAGTLAAFYSGTLQGNDEALSVLVQPDKAPVAATMENK